MASVNKVLLIGNLGQDPELRYTSTGTPVCTLNIATTEVRNEGGNRQEKTEWHRVIVWSKQAENCAKYLSKGRTVFIEGRLQTRSWDDQQSGQKRYSTEIVAQNVQFIGGANAGAGRATYDNASNQLSSFTPPPAEPPSDSMFGGSSHSSLDDIPF
jgi:single-strand DNA-binding protein